MITAHSARQAIGDALDAQLRTLPPAVAVYRGELADPPADRHVVAHATPGRPDPNPTLEPIPADFLWRGQVTAAARRPADLEALLDHLTARLHLWQPEIVGLTCGVMRPQFGVDGPIRPPQDAHPAFHVAVTLWELHVATASAA